jgi:hypothetical protein
MLITILTIEILSIGYDFRNLFDLYKKWPMRDLNLSVEAISFCSLVTLTVPMVKSNPRYY